ncbi:MlaE family lipid ABC transporter permease subunit [Limibaculum sp. M0105]|uniref:MlaE family lipid ABC transporter permease subunit n=1 Tax=Thermohalobaculum xanthum TaxID=2753746 RepID=A0A8J7M504_9RHOB|nr:MlaE family lipid ABC transporter permease subunit [Thermohalobaculum xanthum]
MSGVSVDMRREGDGAVLSIAGQVVMATLHVLEPSLSKAPSGARVVIDLSRVDTLDTGGAWRILQLQAKLEAEGSRVQIVGLDPHEAELLETVARGLPAAEGIEEPPGGFVGWVAGVGEKVADIARTSIEILGFIGLVLARAVNTLIRPSRLRGTALVHHMQEVGFNAVPIVSLMAFLIGVVLAFQGSVQLRQFGAEVFVVNLIAISVLRELGILLTAIIVAGRSGSAFTAAIGSMKIREEIDAMRTLGLDPIEVLVLPRVFALLFMLPVLGFIANVMGLLGGGLMSWIELGVSPGMFIARLYETTDIWHLGVGFIKAPFFAFIIGVIGCYEGLKVEGSAESVGRLTTASVVLSIFSVIVVDAIFSVFFAEIGV